MCCKIIVRGKKKVQSCRNMSAWLKHFIGFLKLQKLFSIAINISRRDLLNIAFVKN